MTSAPVLHVIVASTRPGRVGGAVADWFTARATDHGAFDVEIIDLAEVDLPFFDEPNHPRRGDYYHAHTKAWSAVVSRGDAFAFVTPEYNHGFNAVLKNALDYLSAEWAFKPALIVSYRGVSAGTRAAEMLKHVLLALRMTVVGDVNISIINHPQRRDGSIDTSAGLDSSATTVIDELLRVTALTDALRTP